MNHKCIDIHTIISNFCFTQMDILQDKTQEVDQLTGPSSILTLFPSSSPLMEPTTILFAANSLMEFAPSVVPNLSLTPPPSFALWLTPIARFTTKKLEFAQNVIKDMSPIVLEDALLHQLQVPARNAHSGQFQ